MQNNSQPKNFLIIGGSTGIGNQLALQLAITNQVFATYHKHIPDTTTNSNLSFHACNVLEEVIDLNFLPDMLHGIVYCPGSINLKPFSRISQEDFINDYHLNVLGAIKIIQQMITKLKASGSASIVFFSTVAVQHGFNFHSMVAASKGAIEGLTRALAAELAPSIRVNCIAPSITETPLSSALLNTEAKKEANAARHPLKRIGTAKDIASLTAFLLSDEASWITGQIIAADGGMSSIK